LLAIAKAMGAAGHGVFQVVPKGAVGEFGGERLGREGRKEEHRLYEDIAAASGRPLTYSLVQLDSDSGDFDMMLAESRRAYNAGLPIFPQINTRAVGLISTLDGYHVFLRRPSYAEIAHLPLAERVQAMRNPERRAASLREDDLPPEGNPKEAATVRRLKPDLPNTFVLSTLFDYEPTEDRRVGALAKTAGKTPREYIYDLYTEGDGRAFNLSVFGNYARGSLDHVPPAMRQPNSVCGLGDGGAHVKMIVDAGLSTFQLAFWTKLRTRGAHLPLEVLVNKLTGAPAALYGLRDRGAIALGKRADINVIDQDRLSVGPPTMAHDLPGGASRLLQDAHGYLATMVAGELTRLKDTDTGARPGRLLRGAKAA
jgi:N-acyl-D-aspartate/D-glutamate deacylase